MATLVDALGVLQNFGLYDTVLPFLLIMAGTYAMLTKYKPFGETKAANGIISMIVGLVFISFAKAVQFINLLIPMMTIFLIMLVLALLIFTFIGIKGETIAKVFQEKPEAYIVVILIFVLVFVIVYSTVFPEVTLFIQNPVLAQQLNITPLAGTTPTQQAATFLMFQVTQTILSPQILGLIAMMVVFIISIYIVMHEKED